MERQGRVRQSFRDGTALVLCTGSCSLECGQCEGCRGQTEGMIAQNPEGAQPGELVLVRSRPGKMLAACLMMPVLPVVGFFAGYLVGAAFWNAGRLSGCIALAFGIGAAVIYDRRTASKPGSGYTIIRYP